MAAELCGRAKGEAALPEASVPTANKYLLELRHLDERLAFNFVNKRRCTFSWMTDKTSVYLMNRVMAHSGVAYGHSCLYNLLIGHVINDVKVLESIGFPFRCSKPLLGSTLREHYPYLPLSADAQRTALKEGLEDVLSNIVRGPSDAFAGSTRNLLMAYGTSFEDSLPNFLDDLARDNCRVVRKMWSDMKNMKSPCLEVLMKAKLHGLKANIPFFLALVVSRLYSVNDPRLYNLDQPDIGAYAVKGLQQIFPSTPIRPGTEKLLFTKFCKTCREQLQGFELLRDLDERLCVAPLSTQSFEHLLCEFRKLDSPSQRRMTTGARQSPACFQNRLASILPLLERRKEDASALERSPVAASAALERRHAEKRDALEKSVYVPYELIEGCADLTALLKRRLVRSQLRERFYSDRMKKYDEQPEAVREELMRKYRRSKDKDTQKGSRYRQLAAANSDEVASILQKSMMRNKGIKEKLLEGRQKVKRVVTKAVSALQKKEGGAHLADLYQKNFSESNASKTWRASGSPEGYVGIEEEQAQKLASIVPWRLTSAQRHLANALKKQQSTEGKTPAQRSKELESVLRLQEEVTRLKNEPFPGTFVVKKRKITA